jgi:hypothetical protein
VSRERFRRISRRLEHPVGRVVALWVVVGISVMAMITHTPVSYNQGATHERVTWWVLAGWTAVAGLTTFRWLRSRRTSKETPEDEEERRDPAAGAGRAPSDQ